MYACSSDLHKGKGKVSAKCLTLPHKEGTVLLVLLQKPPSLVSRGELAVEPLCLEVEVRLAHLEQDTPNADHADTTKAYTVPCMRTVYMLYLHNITLAFFTNQKSHLRILKCKIL